LRAGAIAVQTYVVPLLSHGKEFGSKALAQYRGTNLVEATSQVTVQKCKWGQMRVSGFISQSEFVWPAETVKMKINDQKKKERSGPYSTSGFCSAGVSVTRQKP